MFKLYSFKNKKSAIDVSLIHLLEIVLAIGIVIILIHLSLKLSGIFIGRQEYDSTINNLEELSRKVREVATDQKKISTQSMLYTLPDNYILVGFSYDDKGTIVTGCTQETIFKSRSKLCQSKSCLCIYQNFGGVTDWSGKDFDEKGNSLPLKCKLFDEKIIFLAPPPDSNFKGTQTQWQPNHYTLTSSYNYLVLYGECGLEKSWGIRQVYIEKYKENGNIFIFIGDMSDKKIVERNKYFENRNQ